MMEKEKPKQREERNREALVDTACRELMVYGIWNRKMKLKQCVKKYLLKRKTAPEDVIFWPTGFLAVGLWQYRQESAALCDMTCEEVDAALSAYYERWMRKKSPVFYLDDLLAGEVLLSAYEEYEKGRSVFISAQNADRYWNAVEKLVDFGMRYPTDEMGSFPYRAAQGSGHVFVDAIGLACPFLYHYGTACRRGDAAELAVKQIVNFLAYGMDGVTGLPYHGYSMKTTYKYGIIGWGRAAGWLLRGMTGCMTTEYGAERLEEAFVKLIDTVITYQRKDGYFSWQLQALDGPADTSATGMICAALKQGILSGVLTEPKYGQALQAGRNAIRKSIRDGKVYDCSGECEGFGQYPQRYGAHPWSLGPALMLCYVPLENESMERKHDGR